jgi:hypothetical protein
VKNLYITSQEEHERIHRYGFGTGEFNPEKIFFKGIGLWLLISIISFIIAGIYSILVIIISFWIIIPITVWKVKRSGY